MLRRWLSFAATVLTYARSGRKNSLSGEARLVTPLDNRKQGSPHVTLFSITKSLAWSLNCVRHAPGVIKWSSSIKPFCKNICNVGWLLLVWRHNWPSIWLFWSGFAHLYKERNTDHKG